MTHICHSEKVLFMRIFLSVLILVFCLQSLSKADDISDFQIEGISIGDSLLDFVDINYINSDKEYLYKSKDYFVVEIRKNFEKFDSVQVSIKDKDKKYIIQALAGKIFYRNNNINECYQERLLRIFRKQYLYLCTSFSQSI